MPRNNVFFELIVALGNPGQKYENTRHNAGFIVADFFAINMPGISNEFQIKGASLRKFQINEKEIYILKPMEYMNLSGEPVNVFIKKKNLSVNQMIVLHDDMDIELGKIRFSFAAGSAGHKGVQSIIDLVGANFARLRIGIGRESKMNGADFVLSKFSEQEQGIFQKVVEYSASALKFSIFHGIEQAMNKYNGKRILEGEPST
ncbi:MAG TPA: aminoacyl-tRNA hydrolase [Victivallales bacterium]|nr:aminoacyl-tRNA hydrolase [Victivallales bacterium]HRR28746.1 aminoacyl-tRNA hydrolase [Victivallales bacterium]HRU00441.1 aminoacyl-tRNA hydrolase [Victivallales bacterium]